MQYELRPITLGSGIFLWKRIIGLLLLKKLSESEFSDEVVFKGGTSLSKVFQLINRFSEDVDLAILNAKNYSGNQIKDFIRSIEKELTEDFIEIKVQDTEKQHMITTK